MFPKNVFTVRDFAGHVSRLLGGILLLLLYSLQNSCVENDD